MNTLTKALSDSGQRSSARRQRVNTVSPGPVRTAWWTDEGGAAHEEHVRDDHKSA